MLSPNDFIERILKRAEGRAKRPGPEAWCTNCSRFHPRRKPCHQFLRTRIVKHGNRRGRRAGRKPYRTHRWSA